MDKLGRWKFSLEQFSSQIPILLLDKVKVRWEEIMQTAKDIFAKSLRQLLPNLTNAEIKEVMKKNKEKMMMRFHTCFILVKDIEHVVKDAIDIWKNVYHLHKPSEFPIDIKDGDDDSDDEEDNTSYVTFNAEDYQALKDDKAEKDEEIDEEDKEGDEENDPVMIVTQVIASLPHSPRKTATSYGMETDSTSVIVTSKDISSTQSPFATSQL